jgi:hypothetical protein
MQYFVIESKKIKPIISTHFVRSCAGQVLCGHTQPKLSHLLAAREGLKEDRIWRMGSEDTGKKARYPPIAAETGFFRLKSRVDVVST